jgi:hypothetical protein
MVLNNEFITQFVRDRFKETSWRNRDYIFDLRRLERTLSWDGPKQFGEAMHYNMAKSSHPVEWECIRKEIREGVYTSPAEFRKMYLNYCKKQLVKWVRGFFNKRTERKQARTEWIELGGGR